MFKTKFLLIFFLNVIVIGSSFSLAQEKKILKFKNKAPFEKELKGGLNLTEDQKKQFDDLELQHEKQMIDLRAELEKSRLMKRELINKGNFSKNDYLSAEEKIIGAENKIQMEKAKLKMDKYFLLDENQKKIFMDKPGNDFMFNFNIDGFKDGMRMFREKMNNLLPCPPDPDEMEKDIEIEIEDNEI